MNKTEMAKDLASKCGITNGQATEVLNALFGEHGIITNGLAAGDTIRVTGFGTWSTKQRKARTATNPRTGAPIHVPAKRAVAFKAGKTLADRIGG